MADDDDTEEELSGPRPFWSGTIAFGLVSLPVSLFPANRGRAFSLRMVDEEGTQLARRYFCEKEGKPLSREDIVRGYETDDGHWVLVEDEELESLAPEKSREIDLRRFVKLADIDPMYFERGYFLVPDEGATKAYRLLARAMEEEGRAGIASFVMRGKEYLCAIVAEDGILRAVTLRFHDELRSPAYVGLPEHDAPSTAKVKAMLAAMSKHKGRTLPREELADAYVKRVTRYVQKKLKAGKDVVHLPEEEAEELPQESTVIDLMQVLKERLKGTGRQDGGGERRGRGAREAAGKARERRKADRSPKAGGLDGLTREQLYARAQELDIAGRSRMSKDELVRALSR